MNQNNEQQITPVTFQVVPLTNEQIAALYGVGIKTFNRWLQPFRTELGKKVGRYYTNTQVKLIIQKLGMPGEIITG